MPASTTFAPAFFRAAIIVSRLARVVCTLKPRSPSLPPNSTTTTAGCMATNARQPVDAVLGRVAAHPFVHHAIVKAIASRILLQEVRVALALIGPVARRQAVAKANDQRPVSGRRRRRTRRTSGLETRRTEPKRSSSLSISDAAREAGSALHPVMPAAIPN